jgi:hypothetical protein
MPLLVTEGALPGATIELREAAHAVSFSKLSATDAIPRVSSSARNADLSVYTTGAAHTLPVTAHSKTPAIILFIASLFIYSPKLFCRLWHRLQATGCPALTVRQVSST